MVLSVCIIGGGVSGIVSIKECSAQGLSVTCFEKSKDYGGLWSYSDNTNEADQAFKPSIMKTTILNTHKEVMAFSDFPPPPELPNFMKQSQYMDYLRSYVKANHLLQYMKLEHEVLECRPNYDKSTDNCRWLVRVRDSRSGRVSEQEFDKLIIANGHLREPKLPKFEGQDNYKGLILHSVSVKNILKDDRFTDKRVAVVGIGSSACDVANDASVVAEKCFLSSKGCWLRSRLTPGNCYQTVCPTRYENFIYSLAPKSFVSSNLTKKTNARVDHDFLGLKPKFGPLDKKRTIHDLIPYRVLTGGVVLKNPIKRFTENGVIFDGEEGVEYEVDVVVLCTGYVISLPFIDIEQLGIWSNFFNDYALFMNMFPFQISISEANFPAYSAMSSLAFVGQFQTAGPISPICELQARYAALVFTELRKLPPIDQMMQHFLGYHSVRTRMGSSNHNRHLSVGSFVQICDELAELIGAKVKLSKLFFKDYKVWKVLVYDANTPYQYRLKGPGSWHLARETILAVRKRIQCGVNDGGNSILYEFRK